MNLKALFIKVQQNFYSLKVQARYPGHTTSGLSVILDPIALI